MPDHDAELPVHFGTERDRAELRAETNGQLLTATRVPPDFEWYDAWILAAVVYASDDAESVPLWRVVAVADGLNTAIVSRDELELAFGRLIQAGYVRVVPDGFAPTEPAVAFRAPGPPVEHIARAIGAKSWFPGVPMPRTPDETYVSKDAYRKAVKKYGKEFRKMYREEREKG